MKATVRTAPRKAAVSRTGMNGISACKPNAVAAKAPRAAPPETPKRAGLGAMPRTAGPLFSGPSTLEVMSAADQLELFADILLALGLGLAVGVERELRHHEAGLRTIGLVTMGAATFGVVSLTFTEDSRVVAGVVQGVGFLGAGLIFQRGAGLVGLTTAATVWAMAAVGLLVALELRLLATLVTASVIATLELSQLAAAFGRRGGAEASDQEPPSDA